MEASGAPNTFPHSWESERRGTTLGTMLRWVATLMPLLLEAPKSCCQGCFLQNPQGSPGEMTELQGDRANIGGNN